MKFPWLPFRTWILGVIVTGLMVAGCGTAIGPHSAALAAEITVYRSPDCGCCGLWVEHMQAAGFHVQDEISEDMEAIKAEYGLPETLATCHTAIADGYVLEGHIPATDVQRLLAEKPDLAGIAVPGMPIGSPGMESGDEVEPYTVFSFTESGQIDTFAEHS